MNLSDFQVQLFLASSAVQSQVHLYHHLHLHLWCGGGWGPGAAAVIVSYISEKKDSK